MNQPPMPPSLPTAAPASGNKKWILLGCSGCLGLFVIAGIIGAMMVIGITKVIKSTDGYQTALLGAQNSPEVRAELGTPIEAGFMPTGNVNVTNDSGSANLTFSIKGPKGSGAVHYRATRSGGEWHTQQHDVMIDGSGKVIDLIRPPGEARN